MRFRHVLDEVLGQRSKVKLLRFLLRTPGEYSGRDLAGYVGLDHKTCDAALRGLADHGVVISRRVGTAVIHRLHPEHPIVRDILAPAFDQEEGLAIRYVQEAQEISGIPAESVILYGSVARGQEVARSDVDILFVTHDAHSVEKHKNALDEAMIRLANRYGSVPQFMIEDRAAFRRKVDRGDSLHREIIRTGKVVVGKSFRELLTDGGKANRHSKRTSG